MIDLLLLGTGGVMPRPERWLSSLLVRCRGELVLFDCGEGTQIPWQRFGWGFRRLGAICLSHVHADHVAGLPGLLHALANAGRTESVALYGPVGTAEAVNGLRVIAPRLPYELRVTELTGGLAGRERFGLPGGLEGRVATGEHGLPTLAYRVGVGRARRFSAERARALGVPQPLWRPLQRGEAVRWEGGTASPEEVLGPPRRGLALGYVTDTRPLAEIAALVAGVDLLVCEGSYGDPADGAKAVARGHMTFGEAAGLARAAGARALWLTHFSPALPDPDAFLGEATAVFPATTVGYSGLTGTLSFPEGEEGGGQSQV